LYNRDREFLLHGTDWVFIPLNAELNPICHLLALLGAHPILHISWVMVKYNYGYSGFIRLKALFNGNPMYNL